MAKFRIKGLLLVLPWFKKIFHQMSVVVSVLREATILNKKYDTGNINLRLKIVEMFRKQIQMVHLVLFISRV